MEELEGTDFLILPLYLIVIYIIARNIQNSNKIDNPAYEYFVLGLFAKIAGGIFLVIIYTQYYTEGGDTTGYFDSSLNLDNLRMTNFDGYFEIMKNNLTIENFSYFNADIGWPGYYFDPQSFAVVRFTSLFHFISLRRYLITTVLLSTFSYQGIWRLYLLFCSFYPKIYKQLAYSILFVPSVLFWGSGILKDTFTLMGACWFTFSFYKVFIKREKIGLNILLMILNAWLVIQMKPYIFIALVPGALIWLSFDRIQNISSRFLRIIIAPLVLLVILGIASIGFKSFSQNLGEYSSVDKIVNKALITQQDLKQSYYNGNSFDIGTFDGSISSIISKFPIATFAGLFFPQLIQAKNVVMVIAGVENSFLLGLTIFLIIRLGPIRFYNQIAKQPLLAFSIIFSLFFAFSVGLTTSNFGALVRYKIPCIPFFFSTLIVVYYDWKQQREEVPEDNLLEENGDEIELEPEPQKVFNNPWNA